MAKAPKPGSDKPARKGWRFEVFGETFYESELTLDQYIRLEKELGADWRQIHPLRSANHSLQIAALMYSERTHMPFADALAKVGELSAFEFVDDIDLVNQKDDDADPPAADSTTS